MDKSPTRVLVVDDSELWRRYYSTALQNVEGMQVIGEVSDGLEAVQRAQELQPDLILLDIGLPTLNGIEAAHRIREVSPTSKILFVTQYRSADIAEEALSTGACGYVVKSEVESQLLPAVAAVLAGKRFLSLGMAGHESSAPRDFHVAAIAHSHEVAFYADDSSVVDGYARFIESSLKSGNAVIAVLTESHRASILRNLEEDGVDVPEAIEQGCYISVDAADTLSRLVINDLPDPVRCKKMIGDLIVRAAKGIQEANGRVVVCGEMAPTLLSKGNAAGAIELERLWDEIARDYGVRTLCGYLSNTFPQKETDTVFQRICAEHSAVFLE